MLVYIYIYIYIYIHIYIYMFLIEIKDIVNCTVVIFYLLFGSKMS